MFSRLFDSPVHLLILVLIIVVVFGWKRLPDAARSLGRSARILKSEVGDMAGDSKASRETVQGEKTDGPTTAQPRQSGTVPGEAPTPQAQPQNHPTGEQPYSQPQAPHYEPPQQGGPQQGR